MPRTVSLEIPAEWERSVRQFLAFQEEMEQLALTAPDGTVLERCEEAVLRKGREMNVRVLADAVARRIEATEKKGPRSAGAGVAERKKTVASSRASS